MSTSLIRRGLELLSNDFKSGNAKKKKKQAGTPNTAAARALVSAERRGVTRRIKRLQGRLGPAKSKAAVKDKVVECALDKFRKNRKKSPMEANLRYFTSSAFKAAESDAFKIQNHNTGRGRRARRRPDRPAPQKPKETRSLFTEEEFQKFQEEYFGRAAEEEKKPSSRKHHLQEK